MGDATPTAEKDAVHIAVTCDGTDLRLYINGELDRAAPVGSGVTIEQWLLPIRPGSDES